MSPEIMFENGTPGRVLDCQPDPLGNTAIAALVTPDAVYISGHGGLGSGLYNSVILTVDDLDRIRTEMARLEGVK